MPKITLIYPEFKDVLDEYLSLNEFQTLSELTISGKRLALVSFFNYLGKAELLIWDVASKLTSLDIYVVLQSYPHPQLVAVVLFFAIF